MTAPVQRVRALHVLPCAWTGCSAGRPCAHTLPLCLCQCARLSPCQQARVLTTRAFVPRLYRRVCTSMGAALPVSRHACAHGQFRGV